MHPIDKTRTIFFERIFILRAPERKTRKVFPILLNGMGSLKVLSTLDLAFLSLVGEENPDKHRTQRELTK